MSRFLFVGGLIAIGFDATGDYLLAVSHSGRGVFSTRTWERVARDQALVFPKDGVAVGIGPIAGQLIKVSELDSDHPIVVVTSDRTAELRCASSEIEVVPLMP